MLCVLFILGACKTHLHFLLPFLKHSRYQPVRHSIGVAFPVLAILAAAPVLITNTSVDQQDGHVNNVEVWQYVAKATGSTVGQRTHQVTGVVEVTRHAPEARGQELAAVDASISWAVWALNVCRLAPPYGAGAVCAPEQVLLVVGGAEDVISDEAEQQHSHGVVVRELDRVVHQVQTLESKTHSLLFYCWTNGP